MTTTDLLRELTQILDEPIPQVVARQQHALDELLEAAGGQVVLFGAGNLGRRTLACLRTIGIEPLAFADNNEALWNSEAAGVPVISPQRAAEQFCEAAFIVTIWNPAHWYQETRLFLERHGCSRVSPPSPVYWRFPDEFLPFYAQDLPQRVYGHADEVLEAGSIWSDGPSRREFLRQIVWRTRGEWSFFPPDVADRES